MTTKNSKFSYGVLFLILITLGLALFLIKRYQDAKKNESSEDATSETGSTMVSSSKKATSIAKPVFPLAANVYNNAVIALQQKMNEVWNAGITKFGYLGDYTVNFLKSKGYTVPLSKADYDKILSLKKNLGDTSKELHTAIRERNITKALNALKSIGSVEDYKSIKSIFENVIIGVVRKSIVTALLDAFATGPLPEHTTNRNWLEAEFIRIGLKKSGTKWTLG